MYQGPLILTCRVAHTTHYEGIAVACFGHYLSVGQSSQTLMFSLLPHFYACGSLWPKYHPGSPWLPIPPSLLNPTTPHTSAFLAPHCPPLDLVIPTHTLREPCSSFVTCHSSCGQSLSVLEKGLPVQESLRISKVLRFTSMFLHIIRFLLQGSFTGLLPQHHIRHGLSLLSKGEWCEAQSQLPGPLLLFLLTPARLG